MRGAQFGEAGMNASGKAVSVLLVEDESLIAEMIGMALEDHGYAVSIAASASEALDHLAAGAVDILFTDINLPGDMDGADLAVRAREMQPDLPVIYASGRWSLLERLQRMPHSAVLPKPYSLTRALETVELLAGGAGH
jgi:CheY-like chemotaxis protein